MDVRVTGVVEPKKAVDITAFFRPEKVVATKNLSSSVAGPGILNRRES
jgi:hypothetical protein